MKILLLTSIYPQPDDISGSGVTPVVKYFVDEWAKEGHEIIIIHNSNKYFIPFEALPKKVKGLINSKVGMVLPEFSQRKKLKTVQGNIKCYRAPIIKFIPRGGFFNFQIDSQLKLINSILEENDFNPDLILGHWETPQIQLISKMKKKFSCKTGIVLHGISYLNNPKHIKLREEIMNIDIIGVRSRTMARDVKKILNLDYMPFICYSGIPDYFISQENIVKDNDKDTFLYVGQLIKRKNIDTIIKALYVAYPCKDFVLNIVGIGQMESQLRELVSELKLESQVNFMGRVPRSEVSTLMRKSNYFTMVSHREVFGLVYLEALSSGCITIGSKDEGIDGIIEHGFNGFLCEAGNVTELSEVYKNLQNYSVEEKNKIISNGLNTVKKYTNIKVAKNYLLKFK